MRSFILDTARIIAMTSKLNQKGRADRTDISSLEADAAFFDARISLAGDKPNTVYQRAQIKTYKILGGVMSSTLQTLKRKT